MGWRYQSQSFAAADQEFQFRVPATSGKVIKAGGYWLSGSTHGQPFVQVNGPELDATGAGTAWVVRGYFATASPVDYTLTVYVFEK